MYTLNDLIQNVEDVKNAVNSIEVKGRQNALLVVYAHDKCVEILKSIKDFLNKEGETDGKKQFDSEISDSDS